jgi:glycosyltransferase involved in cell wall biosynthesis
MRIAHFATISPNRCGLYGTAKDLIISEKKVGLDAGIVDVNVSNNEIVCNGFIEGYPKMVDDIKSQSVEWARKADIMVRHTLIPTELQNIGKPLVMAMHGRPESSFRLESSGQNPVISAFSKRATDDRYKAFITFWPEYMFQWSNIIPKDKLFYVPAPVDLDYYNPDIKPIKIEESGNPNVFIVDIWRDDIVPFNVIFAAAKFRQQYCKSAKIHIVGLQGSESKAMTGFLNGLKKSGSIGTVCGMTKNIRECYAAADMVITPHVIATRVIRESLACGTPVVAGSGCTYTPYTANPMDIDAFAGVINECWMDIKSDKEAVCDFSRRMAQKCFNPKRTGEVLKDIFERIGK